MGIQPYHIHDIYLAVLGNIGVNEHAFLQKRGTFHMGVELYNVCGTKQIRERTARRRGNGQGTVFKDKNGSRIAECTIGWDAVDGRLIRRTRKKRGFATKMRRWHISPP